MWMMAKNRLREPVSRASGITLIEVLVTLVIVAIGLLGVAGLQATALKVGYVAETRSSGTVYANNIVDRMRANVAAASAYAIAFGTAATATSTQAEKDLKEWKDSLKNLPAGDGEITVVQSVAAQCANPAVARCWEVTVSVRWNEANVRGGKVAPTVFATKTRI
jgi:type IV pilus assembly protein PilV